MGARLLLIPGLSYFSASCAQNSIYIQYFSPDSSNIDYWKGSASVNYAIVLSPGSGRVVATRDEPAATIGLGTGNTSTDRPSTTVHVFSLQQADGWPCGCQIDAIVSTG